jgi:hypothetical protein
MKRMVMLCCVWFAALTFVIVGSISAQEASKTTDASKLVRLFQPAPVGDPTRPQAGRSEEVDFNFDRRALRQVHDGKRHRGGRQHCFRKIRREEVEPTAGPEVQS